MLNQVILYEKSSRHWLCFQQPVQIVRATSVHEVIGALRYLEQEVERKALHAAGFIAYEAAPAFDSSFRVRTPGCLPLLWFGLYRRPRVLQWPVAGKGSGYTLGEWRPTVSKQEYLDNISRIKFHISRGDTYQTNYTFRLRAFFDGNPWDLFTNLVRSQGRAYSAYIDLGRYVICSASPELFFGLDGDTLLARPMKGTAARGRTLQEDSENMQWLQNSAKNRAENAMIVDMIRNDMGRVAEVSSVCVPDLFRIERYPTILQMISTVRSTTRVSLTDILTALFPCASITGAPKIRTMEIISHLEAEPRGVYTGTIGYIAPQRKAQFNVAIRTVTIDRQVKRAEYGVGSGVVWDSEADEEYHECLMKANILNRKIPSFELLETILWQPQKGFFLLELHLQRLADSGEYFSIPVDKNAIIKRLNKEAATFSQLPHKLRLLIAQNGDISVESLAIDDSALQSRLRVGLAAEPVDAGECFLFHKTTNRDVYARARHSRPDCDDVILWNDRGEITESSIANIVVRRDGQLLTPPLKCGLLAGTFRQYLMAKKIIREEVVRVDELQNCQDIFLINSVRKWMRAALVPENHSSFTAHTLQNN